MYNLIIKQEDGTDKIVPARTATMEEIVTWINQAPDNAKRQQRKQMMHYRLYDNPQSLSELLKTNVPTPP